MHINKIPNTMTTTTLIRNAKHTIVSSTMTKGGKKNKGRELMDLQVTKEEVQVGIEVDWVGATTMEEGR